MIVFEAIGIGFVFFLATVSLIALRDKIYLNGYFDGKAVYGDDKDE